MFVSPQNSYVEILLLNVMILGGGAFGKYLGREGGALKHEVSTLIRGPRELANPLISYEDTMRSL